VILTVLLLPADGSRQGGPPPGLLRKVTGGRVGRESGSTHSVRHAFSCGPQSFDARFNVSNSLHLAFSGSVPSRQKNRPASPAEPRRKSVRRSQEPFG
jgi:hypothetical protein